MALIREDRIAETTTSVGAGVLTLGGALSPAYKPFSSVCAVSDTFYAVIEGVDGFGVPTGEWEDGLYTYSAANQITRTIVARSSNANAAVTFSAGTKRVFIAQTGASIGALNIQSVGSAASVTPTFGNDEVLITAQAVGLTLANPTGVAIDGWGIVIRIKDNATAQAIAFGTQYRAFGVVLPTTTVVSKTLYLGIIFNATDTKWDVVSVVQEV